MPDLDVVFSCLQVKHPSKVHFPSVSRDELYKYIFDFETDRGLERKHCVLC